MIKAIVTRASMAAALLAFLVGTIAMGQAQAGAIGAPSLSPSHVIAGTPTAVTVSVSITDPKYIAGSANLQRLRADGTVQAVVGLLRDDGLNGDAVAGDKIYTLRITVQEPSAGTVSFRVSAAYTGELKRTFSATLVLTVDTPPATVGLADVTRPGDAIVPTSNNSPGSEGAANAIDNQPTKYLNFDRLNSGFTVTPSVGATLVVGLTLTSANDAPERDPATYVLEGSLDGVSFFPISSGAVPPFPNRFHKNFIYFPGNTQAYLAYRLIFPTVVGPGGNSMQIAEVELLGVASDLAVDVTRPGDPIVPTSNNSPGSDGVANAIDNQPTKYLNFDRLNTGFTVSPTVGLTTVSGLTLTSANDAPERDPATYVLSGSYDGVTFTQIAAGSVPAFPSRFLKRTILFDNEVPYLHYRLIFPTVVGPGGNSMQIAEVELVGRLAPGDVTRPGDAIVPTSNNSPGSEGAANAIDNQPTKYLNFDRLNSGFTVTPSVGATLVVGLTLTSANDAPERDPATYVLEGSLDGVSFFPISSGAVPPFPNRFHKNFIYFPGNTQAYLAYRLIFPTVVGPGGNSMQIAEVELLGVASDLAVDVTRPGDPIVPTSNNSPGSDGVANAIDNQPTKYLNFDRLNTGFTVSPTVGLTTVSGLTLTSANDAPERDPATYVLSGSYDGVTFTQIAAGSVPAFPSRFLKRTILFDNEVPYLHYRLIFPTVVGPGGNSMQIAEVELLGVAEGP